MKQFKKIRGFTLIEVLVVIGIIAILAAAVVIAINPARQFAQARNSQRMGNIQAILNAIGQNIVDNKGIFTCNNAPFTVPISSTTIASGGAADIRPCIAPVYIPEIPLDPVFGTAAADYATYNTGYRIFKNADQRITVCADGASEEALGSPGPLCVTR